MQGEWKVTSNYLCGETMYGVYRIRDINKVDHSGNREYAGGYTRNKQAAIELAEALNRDNKQEGMHG